MLRKNNVDHIDCANIEYMNVATSHISLSTFICLWLLIFFISCSDEDAPIETVSADNLAEFIDRNNAFPLVTDSLIACAFGSNAGVFVEPDQPVSILFYPEGNATDFRYFETDSANINPDDFTTYKLLALPDEPFFNGYLHRFQREATNENLWGRVTYIKDEELHISNAIRLKFDDLPTEFNDKLLDIDLQEPLSPIFTWQDGEIEENAIYFHVLLDNAGNLISGTYSFDRQFQFYNLSNVVLNIRDITPPPSLEPNQSYQFVMMGVSIDNWVNLIIEEEFQTN